jgi:hypothetical protein
MRVGVLTLMLCVCATAVQAVPIDHDNIEKICKAVGEQVWDIAKWRDEGQIESETWNTVTHGSLRFLLTY